MRSETPVYAWSMDLSYSADEEHFRTEVRRFIDAHLLAATSDKVLSGKHLTREDILG